VHNALLCDTDVHLRDAMLVDASAATRDADPIED
jgi:hypothetical protein